MEEIRVKKLFKFLFFIALGILNLFLVFKLNIDDTPGYLMTCLGIFLIIFAICKYIGIREFILGCLSGLFGL